MARTSWFHFDSSAVSCFRPLAVSRYRRISRPFGACSHLEVMQPFFSSRVVPITSSIAAKVQGIGERMWAPSNDPEVRISPLVGTRKFIRPGSANLRSTPTTHADVVGIVERATVVEIVTDKGDWLEVRTIGRSVKQGWIHRSLLAEKPFG